MLKNFVIENKPNKKYSETESMIDLSRMTFTIPDKFEYSLIEVTKDFVARPDIISHSLYGDTNYSDVICKLNGISNPFELNEGMTLIVPTPEYLRDFFITDTYVEPNTKEEIQRPQPKKKTDKRKANDAIIGDVRYKIDTDRKVIIY